MSYPETIAEITHRIQNGGPKSRRTVRLGIEFRSRLEARFALHLDIMEEDWRYEPAVYGPRGEGYLPDFQILSAPQPTFIEVKPTIREAPEAMRRMEVIWDVHPDALLIVACEEWFTFHAALARGEWTSWPELWRVA